MYIQYLSAGKLLNINKYWPIINRMVETQPIEIITKDFCEKVIENTVSQLRTINGEISDDTLERFKA